MIAAPPAPAVAAPAPAIELADHALVRRFLAASQACALLVLIAGVLVLLGWRFDIVLFKSIQPGLGAMASGTAMALVLSGTTLWLLHPRYDSSWLRQVARVLPLLVMLLGGLTLTEYVLDLDIGIDQMLFADADGAVQTTHPGRMSMVTAFEFLLLGVALLLASFEARKPQQVARAMAMAACVLPLLGFLGLIYGKSSLYAIPAYSGLAIHTAATLLLLAAGILAVQPARGFPSMLVSHGAGGQLSRRLLPYALVVPLSLGWLRLQGEQAALYQTEMGVDLMTVTMIVVLCALVWWNAHQLDAASAKAARAETALRAYADEVRDLYERAPCGYHSLDSDGVFVRINDTELAWLGYRRSEVIGKLKFSDLLTPESRLTFQESFPRFKTQGEDRDIEFELRRKDGSILPVSLSATAVSDSSGRYVMSRSTVFDITDRRRAEQALRASEAAVRALALTDPLTGLANRRRLDEGLRAEIARVERYGGRLSLVMGDLDHFKRVNDEHGHQVGDTVLQEFARITLSHCRASDLAARFGGEEFMIVMPEVGAAEAKACAERIRESLAATTIAPLMQPITASFGVAELFAGETQASLLQRVDQALYRGKAAGRNCVVVDDDGVGQATAATIG